MSKVKQKHINVVYNALVGYVEDCCDDPKERDKIDKAWSIIYETITK